MTAIGRKQTYRLNVSMSRITRTTFFSLLSFILLGCSLLPKVDEDILPTTARVGVVSLIYNHMNFVKLSGVPIYSYHDKLYYVFDWKMDKYVQSSAAEQLKERFNVIDIAYNTAKLKKGFKNTNPYSGLPMFYINSEGIKQEFKRIAKVHNLDAIIVIAQNFTKPMPLYKPYAYGLAYKKLFREKLISFAAISFRVYDANTLHILALSENIEAYIAVEGLPIYTSYNDYSDEEKDILKTWIGKAFDSTIASAIYDLKLN